MDNVPYEQWGDNIKELLHQYKIEEGLVAELGCGTGAITRRLAKAGYDMIGIDLSYEMLDIARQQSTDDILYLCQDMRSFELYGTVRAVVSICDSMNYILREEELKQVFSLVNNYLDPGGIFLFDMNTLYKYEMDLGDHTFAENRDEGSFIWENYFEKETGCNYYDLTLFIKEPETGLFEKFQEEHVQRGYPVEEVTKLLQEAGMEVLSVVDVETKLPPTPESKRVYFIAKEQGKEGRKELT